MRNFKFQQSSVNASLMLESSFAVFSLNRNGYTPVCSRQDERNSEEEKNDKIFQFSRT